MYDAKILADSLNTATGNRLTTFVITYPRIIHQEVLTHRLFSRNSASSRAIPHAKLRERIENDPFIPIYWGRNQSGMQAHAELGDEEIANATEVWLKARDAALAYAADLADLGVHKQIVNRLLEPWMYITIIVSATDWSNYFHLRSPRTTDARGIDPEFPAQPEFQKIARMMEDLLAESRPVPLASGQWHLPLTYPETDDAGVPLADLVKLSAARCARVSYLTHEGKRDTEADLKLHDRLAEAGHWSPFEHPAQAMMNRHSSGPFTGWSQYRKAFPNENHRGIGDEKRPAARTVRR